MQGVADFRAVQEYWLDAWQRSILMLDVLRERGNTFLEQSAKEVPHVLSFDVELVVDGRHLQRPRPHRLPAHPARGRPTDGAAGGPAIAQNATPEMV